jgi:hypothetical protein
MVIRWKIWMATEIHLDHVFKEIMDVFKQEFLPSKEEPEKIEFEPKDDESDSTEEHES